MAITLVLSDDAGGDVAVRGRFARQYPEDLHLDHAAGLGDRQGKGAVGHIDLDDRVAGENRAEHAALHVELEGRVFRAARALVVGLQGGAFIRPHLRDERIGEIHGLGPILGVVGGADRPRLQADDAENAERENKNADQCFEQKRASLGTSDLWFQFHGGDEGSTQEQERGSGASTAGSHSLVALAPPTALIRTCRSLRALRLTLGLVTSISVNDAVPSASSGYPLKTTRPRPSKVTVAAPGGLGVTTACAAPSFQR